jgi:hypothetical protein
MLKLIKIYIFSFKLQPHEENEIETGTLFL